MWPVTTRERAEARLALPCRPRSATRCQPSLSVMRTVPFCSAPFISLRRVRRRCTELPVPSDASGLARDASLGDIRRGGRRLSVAAASLGPPSQSLEQRGPGRAPRSLLRARRRPPRADRPHRLGCLATRTGIGRRGSCAGAGVATKGGTSIGVGMATGSGWSSRYCAVSRATFSRSSFVK